MFLLRPYRVRARHTHRRQVSSKLPSSYPVVTIDIQMLEQGIGLLPFASAGWEKSRNKRRFDVEGGKKGERVAGARGFRPRDLLAECRPTRRLFVGAT